MTEENKQNPDGQNPEAPTEPAEKTEADGAEAGKAEAPPKAAAPEKPSPPKAAAPAGHKPGEKPAAPAKKGPSLTTDISGDPFIDKIKERFGGSITGAVATLGQQIIGVNRDALIDVCRVLHDE